MKGKLIFLPVTNKKSWLIANVDTHTRPPRPGWRLRCGSCPSLWGYVQNMCTRLHPRRWCSKAGWRCRCPSPQTLPALDIFSPVAPPPLMVLLNHTPAQTIERSVTSQQLTKDQRLTMNPSAASCSDLLFSWCHCRWTASWSRGSLYRCSLRIGRVTWQYCRSLPPCGLSSLRSSPKPG